MDCEIWTGFNHRARVEHGSKLVLKGLLPLTSSGCSTSASVSAGALPSKKPPEKAKGDSSNSSGPSDLIRVKIKSPVHSSSIFILELISSQIHPLFLQETPRRRSMPHSTSSSIRLSRSLNEEDDDRMMRMFIGAQIQLGVIPSPSPIRPDAVIEEGTLAYENWVKSSSDFYRQFWLFNVENPTDVIENSAKPVLTQKGPYTYRIRDDPKSSITANDNYTISYMLPNTAVFLRDMSYGSEEEIITSLNLAVAATQSIVPAVLHKVLNTMIKNSTSSLFQNRTVKEILWGYEDPLLKQLQGILPNLDTTTGLFYPYEGTFDGPYTVYTGKDDISKTANIEKYNGHSKLSYWSGEFCNMLNGTDGASFPPLRGKEKIYFFSSDICRSIYAEYEEQNYLKGIPVYRFVIPPKAFASPSVNPENICFCTELVVSKNCTMAGLLSVSSCKEGKPIFVSLPHFLYGSEELTEDIEGLHPNKEEHQTYLDVESTTGFTLQFAKRIQINLMFGPSAVIEVFSKIKKTYIFPVAWLNETAAVNDETAEMFRSSVTLPILILKIVELVLICIGSACFLGCIIELILIKTIKVRTSLTLSSLYGRHYTE
ncbi:platelet glycoprotein 4 [Protopterus annectens]|uniref:platelet glycoprotein 4 n=1 Tax=Protopterus annectens TaxID=7888 RepID=UPI001CFA2AEE|nr:platelet glycoprotein 4 [Protopterus annectens]